MFSLPRPWPASADTADGNNAGVIGVVSLMVISKGTNEGTAQMELACPDSENKE